MRRLERKMRILGGRGARRERAGHPDAGSPRALPRSPRTRARRTVAQ